MHGSFRVDTRISRDSGARLAWPSTGASSRSWATTAFLLSGWTLLGTAWQAPTDTPAAQPLPAAAPPAQVAAGEPARPAPAAVASRQPSPAARFVPVVRIDLPPPAEAKPEVPPAAVVLAEPPMPDLPEPLPSPTPEASAVAALRPVDIEQIAVPGTSLYAPDESAMARKAQIAQLSVPYAVERELALLQEDAPAEVALRLGDRTLGKVAVRVSQINTIDVQLSGLLDLVADRFAPEEFARLRGSAAAESYVPLDQLRAVGLGLRYDPAYDELVVST